MKKEMYCKQKFSLTKVGQKEPCNITSDHNGRDHQLYALSIRFVFFRALVHANMFKNKRTDIFY